MACVPADDQVLLYLSCIHPLDGEWREGLDERFLGHLGDFDRHQKVGGIFSEEGTQRDHDVTLLGNRCGDLGEVALHIGQEHREPDPLSRAEQFLEQPKQGGVCDAADQLSIAHDRQAAILRSVRILAASSTGGSSVRVMTSFFITSVVRKNFVPHAAASTRSSLAPLMPSR